MVSQNCIRPLELQSLYSGRQTVYLCQQRVSSCGPWRIQRPRRDPDAINSLGQMRDDYSPQRVCTV